MLQTVQTQKREIRQWWDWSFRDWFHYFRGFGASKRDAIMLALNEIQEAS